MNILKKKIYFIALFLLIVAIVFLVTLTTNNFKQAESLKENSTVPQNEISQNTETYPPNLLEGKIININASNKTIVIMAQLSKIISDLVEAERTIKIDKAKIVVYNLDTRKEAPSGLSELKEGDGVLVVTEESVLEATATRLQYTSVKITKMIKNENL